MYFSLASAIIIAFLFWNDSIDVDAKLFLPVLFWQLLPLVEHSGAIFVGACSGVYVTIPSNMLAIVRLMFRVLTEMMK